MIPLERFRLHVVESEMMGNQERSCLEEESSSLLYILRIRAWFLASRHPEPTLSSLPPSNPSCRQPRFLSAASAASFVPLISFAFYLGSILPVLHSLWWKQRRERQQLHKTDILWSNLSSESTNLLVCKVFLTCGDLRIFAELCLWYLKGNILLKGVIAFALQKQLIKMAWFLSQYKSRSVICRH